MIRKSKDKNILCFPLKKEKSINDIVAHNLIPIYIFNLSITYNDTCLTLIKKENCIYSKDSLWKNEPISRKEDFQNILQFFEMNKFFSCFNNMESVQLRELIEELFENKNENGIKQKMEKMNENNSTNSSCFFSSSPSLLSPSFLSPSSISPSSISPSSSCVSSFRETKLNNIFIYLFLIILNEEIKKKIESLFSFDSSNSFEITKSSLKNISKQHSVGVLFSGGIDSTLLTIITIFHFFVICKNGYIELINVVFNDNAVDRYTSLISYEHIINLFPDFDIRLVFIDVSTNDILENEKIIFSLISPNTTIMDFNISAALFFANIGKGYICPKTFFKSDHWKNIKTKVFNSLNVNFCQTENVEMGNIEMGNVGMENVKWGNKNKENGINENGNKENGNKENKKKTYICNGNNTKQEKSDINKNKCRVCKHIQNKKCIHQCCSFCCRKLRYIYCDLFFSGNEEKEEKREEIKKKKTNEININNTQQIENPIFKNSFFLEKKTLRDNENINNVCDIYEVQRDEQSNIQFIYLFMKKKKKILIDFEIFPVCSIHRDKVYDYKKISTIFSEFNKELKRNQSKIKSRFEMEDTIENDNENEIENEVEHEDENEDENEIENEIENKVQKNDRQQKGIDETEVSSKENKMERKREREWKREQYKSNDKKNTLHNFILRKIKTIKNDQESIAMLINLFSPGKNRVKISSDVKESSDIKKSNDTIKNNEEDFLNFLNKELYMEGSDEKNAIPPVYICNHELLIIGSGADEFFGGYFRQNRKSRTKENEVLKMKEMEKDIKRLWLRNLYRDDRILSFTSKTHKCIFYPYLNLQLIDFLFSTSFHLVHFPLTEPSEMQKKKENNKTVRNEQKQENIDNIIQQQKIQQKQNQNQNQNQKEKHRNGINFKNKKLVEEIKELLWKDEDLNECKEIYRLIKINRISKWILRMCLFFLNSKEVMFFKKKAIQFGSKSKNIRKYIKITFDSFIDVNMIKDENRCLKGEDNYLLFS